MGTGKEAVAGIARRRRFSAEYKRGVVEETLVRGASVALAFGVGDDYDPLY